MWQDAGNFQPQAVVMEFSGAIFSPCMAGYPFGSLAYYFKYAADTQKVISLFNAVGARVYVASYPIDQSSTTNWDLLNRV